MKALCPKCGGKGCAGCERGQIEVRMAEGDLHTLKCKDCGYENGGRIVNEDLPLRPPEIGCIRCKAPKERCHYVKVAGTEELGNGPLRN